MEMAGIPGDLDAGAAAGGPEQRQNRRNNFVLPEDQALGRTRSHGVFNSFPRQDNRLSTFAVACLMINKTIGTGIFTQPHNVVSGVGNSAFALVLWIVAAIVALCAASCWIELALSVPRALVSGGSVVATPKSGGDKNYLEYIFKTPDLLITCVYGITFLVFGNLAGNAIQFGIFMQTAINPMCQEGCMQRGHVVGWALLVLILCALINVTTRKGAIFVNNFFAVSKISMVVVMIFLGIGWGTAHGNGCASIEWKHKGEGGGFGNVVQALTFAMYPSSGFEQPFYVLAEVRQPRRLFAPTVMSVMTLILVLHPLINTSYFCVNPYEGPQAQIDGGYKSTNAAINYFWKISGATGIDGRLAVVRSTSVLLGLSSFGNLLAVVYTAPRVKQEIAKEGILPRSFFFAAGKDSILSRFGRGQPGTREQVPMAATALHLTFEIILVLGVGLTMEPTEAYNTLSYLYTYVITGILGFLVVLGLLYLKVDGWVRSQSKKGRHWNQKSQWSLPLVGPLPCIIAVLGLGLVLFGVFVEPSRSETGGQKWWLKPLVGWCGLSLGVLWWLGMELRQWNGQYRIRRSRITYVEEVDDGDLVQTAERVVVDRAYKSDRVFGSLPG